MHYDLNAQECDASKADLSAKAGLIKGCLKFMVLKPAFQYFDAFFNSF